MVSLSPQNTLVWMTTAFVLPTHSHTSTGSFLIIIVQKIQSAKRRPQFMCEFITHSRRGPCRHFQLYNINHCFFYTPLDVSLCKNVSAAVYFLPQLRFYHFTVKSTIQADFAYTNDVSLFGSPISKRSRFRRLLYFFIFLAFQRLPSACEYFCLPPPKKKGPDLINVGYKGAQPFFWRKHDEAQIKRKYLPSSSTLTTQN